MVVEKPMQMILAGASVRLGQIYPDTPVYVEAIKQHLPDKSFVLFCVPGLNRKVTDKRYRMTGNLDISYIVRDDSDEGGLKIEFADKYQELSTQMGTVNYNGNIIRFTDFSYQVVDNVLHTLASFEIEYFVEDSNG